MVKIKHLSAEITKVDSNVFSLTFSDLDCVRKTFNEYGLPPDGHTWERAIDAYCNVNSIDISLLEFDSESDLFAAYSKDKGLLQATASIIEEFITNPKCLREILEKLDGKETEEFSVSEFIEDLEYNEYDLSKPLEIIFFLDFEKAHQAKKACETSLADGYKCFLDVEDNNAPFAAIINIIPEKSNLESRIEFFKELANSFNGKFDFCDTYDQFELDELNHWKLYEK